MSNLGALTTGAGIASQFVENSLYEFLMIGTVDTDLPIQGISVTISGDNTINIQNQAMIQAFSKFGMAGLLGADVKKGMAIPIAAGGVGNKQVNFVLTNSGATTPNVYGFSTGRNGGLVIRAAVQTINANSNFAFEGFSGLIFDPTNFSQATATFPDGWVEGALTAVELDAIFASKPGRTTDADGRLAGLTVLDGNDYKGARIFAGSSSLDVLVINIAPL